MKNAEKQTAIHLLIPKFPIKQAMYSLTKGSDTKNKVTTTIIVLYYTNKKNYIWVQYKMQKVHIICLLLFKNASKFSLFFFSPFVHFEKKNQ